MNKQKTILLGTALIIAGIGIGRFASTYDFSVPQAASERNLVVAVSDLNKEWEIYTSKNFGVTFYYPKDAQVTETGDSINVSKLTGDRNFKLKMYYLYNTDILDAFETSARMLDIKRISDNKFMMGYQSGTADDIQQMIAVKNFPNDVADDGKKKTILKIDSEEWTPDYVYEANPSINVTNEGLPKILFETLEFTN